MTFLKKNGKWLMIIFLVGALMFLARKFVFQSTIDYNTDVKPILNRHCISCHGGVKQSGGFSLMTRTTALLTNDSGNAAILPGDADGSEMIKRIKSDDPEERMPQEGAPLSKKDIEILEKWIEQGAPWGLHWAYQPLQATEISKTRFGIFTDSENKAPASSQLDDFVAARLEEIGLSHKEEASKAELLRRVSMDIIGIPAPTNLQEMFLSGKISYHDLVDSLLADKGYGEKWATMWLDIARYADSKGFERDMSRTIWPFRDYVIRALNADKPYDQFVIEQLAGDMLDNPTEEQYIATGFHRNTTTNDEGGTNNEEFRVKAVMDRVATTWEGMLGTTMACVQCHGHPYDPFTHEDYYASYALFNNSRDADTYMDYPRYKLFNASQEQKLDSLAGLIDVSLPSGKVDEIIRFIKTGQPVIYSIETDQLTNAALYDTKYLGLRNNGYARLPYIDLEAKDMLIIRYQNYRPEGYFSLHLDSPDGEEIGRVNLDKIITNYKYMEIPLRSTNGIHDIYLKYSGPSDMSPDHIGIQFDWFHFTADLPCDLSDDVIKCKELFYSLLSPQKEHTLIMVENPSELHRETFLFDRGNWQAKTYKIDPGIPAVLNQTDQELPGDRLAFAKWITNIDNPLTARTFVNRIWEQLFGQGIVSTTGDLGSQGEIPSHPELLDYLAYQWMHYQDWKIKELIKTILLTKTYRQSARVNAEIMDKDPYNRYLSRGPRIRLSAEQIRDQALSISGLLSDKMYGPPVMPYQPEGIWQTPYNNEQWAVSEGEDAHRRSVYTFIKRSSVYPSMETFDGAKRQVCTSRRIRTNTPLQALVTLNDPVFVEASENLAERMQAEGGKDIGSQIEFAYRLAMSQDISQTKKKILEELYRNTFMELEHESNDSDLALTTVANAIMNLDEFLNK